MGEIERRAHRTFCGAQAIIVPVKSTERRNAMSSTDGEVVQILAEVGRTAMTSTNGDVLLF